MASKTFKVLIGTMLGLAVGGTCVVVYFDNIRLRQRIAEARNQSRQVARLREDNRQTQQLLGRVQVGESEGAQAIHAEVVRVRSQVEELERKARADYAQVRMQAAQDAENLVSNRDPEKGLVRLEYFKNVGQATPSAAFQTFVWAAMKGEDARLAGMIALDAAAREKGLAVVAALPEEARAKYPTLEKLAALFVAAALTAQPAAQISEVVLQDPQHAVLVVRGLTDKPQKIPLQLEPQGWQVTVSAGMAENLGRWATGGGGSPGKK